MTTPGLAQKSPTYAQNGQQPAQDSLTVGEKIFRVQHEHSFHRCKTGPELELFFHELKNKETTGKHIFSYLLALSGVILLICLYPFIALAIKISGAGTVVQKIKMTGQLGHPFSRYEFRTTKEGSAIDTNPNDFWFGRMLKSTGLYKLPSVIHIFQGTMAGVGPAPYPVKKSTFWNNRFDEWYKRYAVKPGFISVCAVSDSQPADTAVEKQLRKEFKYIIAPTFKNDIRVLFGNF